MKKTTSIYKVQIEEVRPDHFHLRFKAGSGEVDAVFERSSLRHIMETIDSQIGTGLKNPKWEKSEDPA